MALIERELKRDKLVAAEVAHTGQGHGDEAVQEFVHARAAQCDHRADGLAFANLESGNGFLGLGDHRLLAGDLGEVGHSVVHDFLVGYGLRDPHVQGDLGDAGHLHRGLVAELGGQLGDHLLAVMLLQSCHVNPLQATLISSPEDLNTRTRLSPWTLMPTRSALPVAGLKIATLD